MRTKYYILLSLIVWAAAMPLKAQYEVAAYSYAQNYFNNGQPLPAESNLIVTGEAPANVARIEISIYKAKANHNRPPLYQATWIRPEGQKDNGYSLPLNYKLHGNSDYDIVFAYFKPVTDVQRKELKELVNGTIDRLVDQAVQKRGDKLETEGSARRLQNELEDFVQRALATFRTAEGEEFAGFSAAANRSLDALFDLNNGATEAALAEATLSAQNQMKAELNVFLQKAMTVRSEQRTVRDYPTEKVAGSVAVNVGYGGVYLDGDIENLTYGEGVYVGLSLPLGSRAFSGRFLSNTSISVGAFLQNFEGDQGDTYTGPIFGRPYFVGLGYSLFRFVRLNAGAVALEKNAMGNGGTIEAGAFQIKPFIGISAELNLSLSLGQKRN